MILYRCGRRAPTGAILPSNWAVNSAALEIFISNCDDDLIDCGDTIFVVELPNPLPEQVGEYYPVRHGHGGEATTTPFGQDAKGWWSFNRPYEGPYRLLASLPVGGLNYAQIDALDLRFQPAAV